jgi:hypothetical protein
MKAGSITHQINKKEAIPIIASFLLIGKLIKVTDQSISRDAGSSSYETS